MDQAHVVRHKVRKVVHPSWRTTTANHAANVAGGALDEMELMALLFWYML